MNRFLMIILATGVILPLCTQAAMSPLGGDGDIVAVAPMGRAAADPCGHAQTEDQDIPAGNCLAHCLSARGMVSEQSQAVTGDMVASAWIIGGAASIDAAADRLSSVSSDDHILRMLLYNRLSGVIMRN